MNKTLSKLAGKAMLMKIAHIKKSFTPGSQMGGAPMDPAMAGGAPMDPAMAGGAPMDPAMMGGAPMDPSMGGGMEMAGGQAPVDPNTGMPIPGAEMGGAPAPIDDPMMIPITELTVGDLMAVMTEVMGSGAEQAAEPKPEEPKNSTDSASTKEEDTNSRLDQIIELLGGVPGGPGAEMSPAGPEAMAPAPAGVPMSQPVPGMEVAAGVKGTIADLIIDRVSLLRK